MVYIKRQCFEVSCEFCSKRFMQTRSWQRFCSRGCLKNSEKTAKSELKKMIDENNTLRREIERLQNLALDHLNTPKGATAPSKPFRYDDESQDTWVDD